MLVPGGTHQRGVPVGRACECSLFTVSTELDQPASRGPVGWVRGPGSGQGSRVAEGLCWCSGSRLCLSACRSDRLSVLAPEEEGTWLWALVCDGGPVRGCCWRQCLGCGRLCDRLRLCVLCVTGCVRVCLWDTCSALLLVEPAKGKAAALSLVLGRAPRSPVGSLAGFTGDGGSS